MPSDHEWAPWTREVARLARKAMGDGAPLLREIRSRWDCGLAFSQGVTPEKYVEEMTK